MTVRTTPAGDTGTLTPSGTWSVYNEPNWGNPTWRIDDDGFVNLSGLVAATGSDATIATLPAKARPAERHIHVTYGSPDAVEQKARVDIDAAGLLTATKMAASGASSWGYLSLNGIRYRAENTPIYKRTSGADPGWVAPALLNSFTDYGAPFTTRAHIADTQGVVQIKGLLARTGALVAGQAFSPFTVPTDLRPVRNLTFPCVAQRDGVYAHDFQIQVGPGGLLVINGAAAVTTEISFVSLDGIHWQAGA